MQVFAHVPSALQTNRLYGIDSPDFGLPNVRWTKDHHVELTLWASTDRVRIHFVPPAVLTSPDLGDGHLCGRYPLRHWTCCVAVPRSRPLNAAGGTCMPLPRPPWRGLWVGEGRCSGQVTGKVFYRTSIPLPNSKAPSETGRSRTPEAQGAALLTSFFTHWYLALPSEHCSVDNICVQANLRCAARFSSDDSFTMPPCRHSSTRPSS